MAGTAIALLKKHYVLWAVEIIAILFMLVGYYILVIGGVALPVE